MNAADLPLDSDALKAALPVTRVVRGLPYCPDWQEAESALAPLTGQPCQLQQAQAQQTSSEDQKQFSCSALKVPLDLSIYGTWHTQVQRTKVLLPQQRAQHVLPKPGTSRLLFGDRPSTTTFSCAKWGHRSLLLLHRQADDWREACELQTWHALHAGQGGRIQSQAVVCRCKTLSSQPCKWLGAACAACGGRAHQDLMPWVLCRSPSNCCCLAS